MLSSFESHFIDNMSNFTIIFFTIHHKTSDFFHIKSNKFGNEYLVFLIDDLLLVFGQRCVSLYLL